VKAMRAASGENDGSSDRRISMYWRIGYGLRDVAAHAGRATTSASATASRSASRMAPPWTRESRRARTPLARWNLVIGPVARWGRAHHPAHEAGEVALIGEPGGQRDLGDRCA